MCTGLKKVHAAEVLRALQGFSQVRDRNGRRIGCKNRVITNLRFGLHQHRVFDLRVLHDGLDHNIDIVETVVTQGRLDLVEDACHLGSRDPSTFNLFGQ